MKPITKIIIFLVVAFIIVIGITLATRSVVAPVNTGEKAATTTAKTYTLVDVTKHKTPTDCWTSVNGGVYDLTPFVNEHPGGVRNITKLCGIEGTATFTAQHGGQAAPESELASLKIGTLAK